MITLLTVLTVFAQVAVVGGALTWMLHRVGIWTRGFDAWRRWIAPDAIRLAWLVAAVAMTGSLYMSQVRHFLPCELCWYQRIAMYPLVVVLGIAALRGDERVRLTASVLAGVGAVVSIYHYQLERFPDQTTISCSSTVPCTTVWFERLGYITIPMMALTAFALIALILNTRQHDG